jgi:hypothetical protein
VILAIAPVPGKLEEEFTLMAAMRYMPYVSGKMAALGTRQATLFSLDVHFRAESRD